MLRTHLIALGLALGALVMTTGMTRACALDAVPSLLVNGRLVLVNVSTPDQGQMSRWAAFVAPGVYQTGRTVQLQEVRSRLLTTLPPSAFRISWRWTFGDGTATQGSLVRHSYRHPGTYVVGVLALLTNGHISAWYLFDSAEIRVR